MQSIDKEIISMCQQIATEKLKIESAIACGVAFEEVKKIVLNLRELKKKLGDYIFQIQEPRNSGRIRPDGGINLIEWSLN